MKNVIVLGTACCGNCENTIKLIAGAAKDMGVDIRIEKVENLQDIMAYGIMSMPGVVIDGKVVHAGSMPSREKINGWLNT
ncbi:MAG: thioredoxin family protein [Betaproteobacteria bacterium]|nr:thioredoxin family protein [Betaproteobacteria bacterium]